MEEQVPVEQSSNRFAFFKQNKKITLYTIGVAILFVIIIVSIVVMNTKTQQEPKINQTKPTPVIIAPTAFPTVIPQPTKTVTLQQRTDIINQTQTQLQQSIQIEYTVPNIKSYGDNWAIMEVANPSTDTAHVIVQKVNGSWKVMKGPGTNFDPEELKQIGAPQSLIDEVNTGY